MANWICMAEKWLHFVKRPPPVASERGICGFFADSLCTQLSRKFCQTPDILWSTSIFPEAWSFRIVPSFNTTIHQEHSDIPLPVNLICLWGFLQTHGHQLIDQFLHVESVYVFVTLDRNLISTSSLGHGTPLLPPPALLLVCIIAVQLYIWFNGMDFQATIWGTSWHRSHLRIWICYYVMSRQNTEQLSHLWHLYFSIIYIFI